MSNTIKIKPDTAAEVRPHQGCAGQAGIEPFCVKTKDFTKQQIIEIHRLAVEAGANNYECPKGSNIEWGSKALLTCEHYCSFGVTASSNTYFSGNDLRVFNNNVLASMEEVYKHLGIKQERPTMKSAEQQQQPTRQAVQAQNKSSNKGLKILPKTSNLLEFIYAESKYTVRGVTSFEIVHEAPSLLLKYDFQRTNQNGHVQGSEKIKIFGDLEKIVFKTPSDFDKNVYKQKIVLNLKG